MVEPGGPVDVGAHGERIEALLEASAVAGPVARDRAEQLVRLVVELYGAGLERLLEIAHDAGALDEALLDRIAGDPLVSSLLLVHGLHPYGLGERVERALADVRPYLRSHGGDVELLGVAEDGTVGLRLLGHCDGCAGSTATLTTAVREAIEAAAPEVTRIDVAEPTAPAHPAPVGTLIPAEALTARLREAPA
jgi:Fe-S cluster biogenesis protein NfuA